MSGNSEGTYEFLLDTYETEILKITGLWSAFPDDAMDFKPAPKSRTIPAEKTRRGYTEKYRTDATKQLALLRAKPDEWWHGSTTFVDLRRSRAWVFMRRWNRSTYHRGQLVVYLRLLGIAAPSVDGPTADTGDKVIYKF
jgi:hypothetical protein